MVVFFYPKDGTPVCTAQACGFRDGHADLARAGAVVVGVSPDSDDSHATTAARHGLPFALISDADGRLHGLFGVGRWMGMLPGRATFVIGPDGVVRHICRSWWRAGAHARGALEAVRRIMKQGVPAGGTP